MLKPLTNKLVLLAAALLTPVSLATVSLTVPVNAYAAVDRIVAVINNEPLTQSELVAAISDTVRELKQRKVKLPPEEALQRQTLENLISERVLTQEADRRRVKVSPVEVDNALLSIAKRNKLSPREFRTALSAEGIDYATYRRQIESRLRVQKMIDAEMSRSVEVLENEVDLLVDTQTVGTEGSNEYDISRILIPVPSSASSSDIELARGKAEIVLDRIRSGYGFEDAAAEYSRAPEASQGGRIGWMKTEQLPALYLGALVRMKAGDVTDVVRGPNGFQILKLNDRRTADQKIVKQFEFNQILMRANTSTTEEEVLVRLGQLRERITLGEDFATLAGAHSQDPVSQSEGGRVGWVALQELTDGLRKVVGELAQGEVSQPVRSPFGFHLIKITDTREQDVTDEFRRNAARQEIYARKSEEYYEDWVRQLRDQAYVEYR